VWLTTVDSGVMHDPAEAQRALAFLRHNGFRRAALPLYTAGVVTWSPAPARNRLAIPTDPLLPPPQRRRTPRSEAALAPPMESAPPPPYWLPWAGPAWSGWAGLNSA